MYGHPVLTGPFRGTEALAAGLLTHNGLYGPRFQRLFSGVFAPADLAVDLVTTDALARLGSFSPTDLVTRRHAEPGARGCRRLDEAVALAPGWPSNTAAPYTSAATAGSWTPPAGGRCVSATTTSARARPCTG